VVQGLLLAIILLSTLVTAGCNGEGEDAEGEATQSPLATPGGAAASSPVPTPGPGLADWDAQPAVGTANLRGRIEITEPTVLLGELFLARAMPTSNPDIDLLELSEKEAPRALIDRTTGEFLFVDVEPGKYGLIVWEPMRSAPINDPETKETLFIQLSADQVTDIGALYFP
jgi:hypothetical protein